MKDKKCALFENRLFSEYFEYESSIKKDTIQVYVNSRQSRLNIFRISILSNKLIRSVSFEEIERFEISDDSGFCLNALLKNGEDVIIGKYEIAEEARSSKKEVEWLIIPKCKYNDTQEQE